jgi:PAS domain S-box-containing protein
MGQYLAAEDERLREALVDLERSRGREARARLRTETLLHCLESMTRARSPSKAISVLLDNVASVFEADSAAIIVSEDGRRPQIRFSTDDRLQRAGWPEQSVRLGRPRRIAIFPPLDDGWSGPAIGSAMMAPLAVEVGEAAVVCLSARQSAFSVDDSNFLKRLAALAEQALTSQRLWDKYSILAGVVEGSTNSISICDARSPGFPVIYVNPAHEALTGIPAGELVARPWSIRTSAHERDEVARAEIMTAMQAQRAGQFELTCRRADGTGYDSRVNIYPVAGEDGAVSQIVAIHTDITERRRAEAERDAAQQRLDAALSATTQGFLVIDSNHRVAYANAAFAAFFPARSAWRPGTAVADTLAGYLESHPKTPPDPAGIAGDWLARIEAGIDQEEVWLDDETVILLQATPTPEGGSVVTVTDITATKRTEALLAERVAAIDAAQDGIALTDAEGRFRYMNPSHMAMFGLETAAEVEGRSWETLYEPDEAAKLREQAFGDVARLGGWRGEAVGRRIDGEAIEQEISLTRLSEGGLVCVTRDISDRRRGERERMKLRDQLQSAHRREAAGQIAAGIAHDFNNLLSAISGSASLAAQMADTASPIQVHLERISNAAVSGADLMRRLLDLGATEKKREDVDLCKTIRDVADLVSADSGLSVVVDTELPASPVHVRVDPGDMLHLLLNLAVNARDALGDAGGRVTMGLGAHERAPDGVTPVIGRLDPDRRYMEITVADTGSGIEADRIAEIFKAYVSSKGKRGTGLGLSIVSSVVSEAGAAIAIETRLGEGTRFSVFWPTEAEPSEIDHVLHGEPASLGSLKGTAILVAEDRIDMLEALTAFLERMGAEVGACDDPETAAEAIEEDPGSWDLLLTDFQMPGMTGGALARRARAASPGIATILCTGLGASSPELGPHRHEFDAVINKPVAESMLLQVILQVLSRKGRL